MSVCQNWLYGIISDVWVNVLIFVYGQLILCGYVG